jgi:hypothetical protein
MPSTTGNNNPPIPQPSAPTLSKQTAWSPSGYILAPKVLTSYERGQNPRVIAFVRQIALDLAKAASTLVATPLPERQPRAQSQGLTQPTAINLAPLLPQQDSGLILAIEPASNGHHALQLLREQMAQFSRLGIKALFLEQFEIEKHQALLEKFIQGSASPEEIEQLKTHSALKQRNEEHLIQESINEMEQELHALQVKLRHKQQLLANAAQRYANPNTRKAMTVSSRNAIARLEQDIAQTEQKHAQARIEQTRLQQGSAHSLWQVLEAARDNAISLIALDSFLAKDIDSSSRIIRFYDRNAMSEARYQQNKTLTDSNGALRRLYLVQQQINHWKTQPGSGKWLAMIDIRHASLGYHSLPPDGIDRVLPGVAELTGSQTLRVRTANLQAASLYPDPGQIQGQGWQQTDLILSAQPALSPAALRQELEQQPAVFSLQRQPDMSSLELIMSVTPLADGSWLRTAPGAKAEDAQPGSHRFISLSALISHFTNRIGLQPLALP